ncbi:MAG TPA: rRNA maturation RNase YbeY [Aggregatilinea sp.]|uniref:rRNA maturation RNase YbeY n=1 Tax=Aggregatilinea sp. TaxID=2806333 RepID=UPI002BB8E307|nr:rRNA maturation RNase YbeY [Aggregatilinea sp.]HML22181.1 rRNA maturation RNase YbeY [Aggregatilinea sp.]
MSYDINVQVMIETERAIPEARLVAAATWVLDAHELSPEAGLSIVISDDVEIRQLNRQFRDVDKPTDVLSFPADPDPDAVEDAEYLGDLVLALPYIERQAAAEQHSVEDEMTLAVVHGTLHLLGYDHDTTAHQAEMWEIQAEALAALGVAIVVPQFEFPEDGVGETDSPE